MERVYGNYEYNGWLRFILQRRKTQNEQNGEEERKMNDIDKKINKISIEIWELHKSRKCISSRGIDVRSVCELVLVLPYLLLSFCVTFFFFFHSRLICKSLDDRNILCMRLLLRLVVLSISENSLVGRFDDKNQFDIWFVFVRFVFALCFAGKLKVLVSGYSVGFFVAFRFVSIIRAKIARLWEIQFFFILFSMLLLLFVWKARQICVTIIIVTTTIMMVKGCWLYRFIAISCYIVVPLCMADPARYNNVLCLW